DMRLRLHKTSTLAAPAPTGDGGLIVADLWGRVYRRDASTGRLVWKKQVGVPVINTSCYSRGRPCILGGPVIAGDSLLVGGADGMLHCFDMRDGGKRWRLELGGPVNSTPAVGADAVYCSTFDGSVFALRPT
ncbi:MAG: PQQ-binding-like beta-propeller repeat protein, partial [Planctomycetes bacterium]|nr:PQQ-binding-like beta-propeller repeat protein [Planctomycetota bacterium]